MQHNLGKVRLLQNCHVCRSAAAASRLLCEMLSTLDDEKMHRSEQTYIQHFFLSRSVVTVSEVDAEVAHLLERGATAKSIKCCFHRHLRSGLVQSIRLRRRGFCAAGCHLLEKTAVLWPILPSTSWCDPGAGRGASCHGRTACHVLATEQCF